MSMSGFGALLPLARTEPASCIPIQEAVPSKDAAQVKIFRKKTGNKFPLKKIVKIILSSYSILFFVSSLLNSSFYSFISFSLNGFKIN